MSTARPRDERHTSTFLQIGQVAERWQCSEKKVRRLIDKGELIAHRFGRLVRINLADLLSYERQNRIG